MLYSIQHPDPWQGDCCRVYSHGGNQIKGIERSRTGLLFCRGCRPLKLTVSDALLLKMIDCGVYEQRSVSIHTTKMSLLASPSGVCVALINSYTFQSGAVMRTNIVIDNGLMRQAMKATGLSTKKAVVEEGLRLLIKVKAQEGIRRFRGKVAWKGDLSVMRESSVKVVHP